MKYLLALFAFFAVTASAADITGNWKATADFGNGPIERTFTFKVDGSKLSGETSSELMGKSTIENGKIDGGKVTFTIKVNYQGNDLSMEYKGKVTGDTIKMTVEIPNGGPTIEWTAKKV